MVLLQTSCVTIWSHPLKSWSRSILFSHPSNSFEPLFFNLKRLLDSFKLCLTFLLQMSPDMVGIRICCCLRLGFIFIESLFNAGPTRFEAMRPLTQVYQPSAMIPLFLTSSLKMYVLGIMMKFRQVSKITIIEIRSGLDSGFSIWKFTPRQTKPAMNSKDHEITVIWRLTLFILRRLSFELSDNTICILSLLSFLKYEL